MAINVKNEIESIKEYLLNTLPKDIKYNLQNMPKEYSPNGISIRFVKGTSESETKNHYRLDRLFQLVYFGKSEIDCLTQMSLLEEKFNNEFTIPLKGETRKLTIGSFSSSEPFKTESGVYAIIGMLETHIRVARRLIKVPKINEVTVTMYTEVDLGSWSMVDGSLSPDIPDAGFTWDDIEQGRTLYDKAKKQKEEE